MWLGELITDRGIGNGMSLLIFTSIVAGFPAQLWAIQRVSGWFTFALVLLIGLVMVAGVVFVEQAQRRIPVQYAKRHDRPADVRRHLDLHPAQGQPGRRHPGHLRLVAALPARPCSCRSPAPTRAWSTWIQRNLVQGDQPIYVHHVLPADHLLHLLLRRDHVQPRRGRRQHEEVRRLHPGHPGRQADRGVPRLRAHPDHRCPGRSTSAFIAVIPIDRLRPGQRQPEASRSAAPRS